MAILTTFKHTGDADEMMKLAADKVGPVLREAGAEHGQLSSTIARTSDGIMLFNLWESEAGMRRAAQHVGPIARASGLPPQEDWQMYEVIVHRQSSTGPATAE